jgi:xanthine dehydrogenase YagT iron-sulfur-binding subunit
MGKKDSEPDEDVEDGPGEVTPGGLSRRAFLRGSAAAGLGAGLLRGAPAEAAPAAARAKVEAGVTLLGPGAVPMSFQVNGHPYSAKLEPRTTLLDALREHFDLTGAKKVCDRGTCGACTVILDGKAVYACSLLALEAQGRDLRTVEGLGTPGTPGTPGITDKLHPLQAAFVENDAHQCGFCTPGFVMAAKALLDANPDPSLPEIHHALSGNFCRCGTYAGIRAAVLGFAAANAAAAAAGEPPPGSVPEGEEDAPKPKKKKKKRRSDG